MSFKSTGLVFKSRDYIGSVEPPATVLEDESRFGNNGSMTTAKPDLVQLPSGLWVFSYNGTDAVVDVGNLKRNIKAVCLWIYPDNHTRALLDLDGGTHSIEIDANSDITATGWASPTIYVDAVVAAAITLSKWNFVAVTTATAIDANDVDLGKEASYFDGYQALYKMFGYAPSAAKLAAIFQAERHWFGV